MNFGIQAKTRRSRAFWLITVSGVLIFGTPVPTTEALNLGTMVHLQVESPETDYPLRDVYVWTPALNGEDPNTLPIVYMLHGWTGSPAGMISAVDKPLAAAFEEGATPFIAVFPDGNATTHPDSEWADSSDKKAMVETWLTTKVIPAVEHDQLRTPSQRAIMGFSMGGYGAAIIALHHPNLFGQVISVSGYFVTDDLTQAFSSNSKIEYQTPTKFLKVANKMRWFLAEGRDDFTDPIRGQAVFWGKKLKEVKASVSISLPAGGHSFTVVSSQIPAITKWIKWPES